MTTTIKYLNSFDEVTWLVDTTVHTVRCCVPWYSRSELRAWLKQCCTGTVWIWNGVSAVTIQDLRQDSLSKIDESRVYVMFEHNEDCEMFMLKYAAQFKSVSLGADLTKVWHDSRKNS